MRVWQVFNRYRESVNGEEHAVINTHELLTERGIQSRLMLEDSKSVDGPGAKLIAALGGIYNPASYRRMRKAIRADRPDLVHAHNLLPLYSPSVLKACHDESVPVIATIHNFFLTCPVYTHFRGDQVCNSCRESSELACTTNNCRDSHLESFAYALRTWSTRVFGLYLRYADSVIALTRFAQQGLIDYGFAEDQVSVLPNFSPLRAPTPNLSRSSYVAYAGRLNSAKGIDVLLEAARQLDLPIKIAGGGMRNYAGTPMPNVEFLGVVDREQMLNFYRGARFVVVPSLWYEMCPLVILEAMSLGLPVIASRTGGLAELVDDGRTGFLFEPGDARELARKIRELWRDLDLCSQLGAAARRKFRETYSPEIHFDALNDLYKSVLGKKKL